MDDSTIDDTDTLDDNIINLDPLRTLAKAIDLKKSEIAMVAASADLSPVNRAKRLGRLNLELARMEKAYETARKADAKADAKAAQAQAKADAKAKAAEAGPDDFADDRLAAWRAFLAKNDLHFVQDVGKYVRFFPDGSYKTLTQHALETSHAEFSDEDDRQVFKTVMAEQARMHAGSTMTFGTPKPWELNLVSRDHHIKPEPGDYHPLFDLVMHSLGGGRAENVEHLERVLAWKFRFPAEFKLPTPVIFGQGELGKNLFFEEVLATAVGNPQVGVLLTENVLGSFNGLVPGKMFVLLNEAVRDAVSMPKFKAMTAAKHINVNEKYGLQYIADNTALVWCGGNGISAGITLAGDKSDRRWSIIRAQKSLLEWIIDTEGFAAEQEADEWFQRERHHLSDPAQVAHWLHALLTKHGGDKYRPRALHGVDYRWLMEQQKRTWQEVAEAVFDEDGFSHIHAPLLYAMYVWYTKTTQPSGRYILKKGDFFIHVDDWAAKFRPEVMRHKCTVVGKKKATRYDYYMAAGVFERKAVEDNDIRYEVYQGHKDYPKLTGYTIPGVTLEAE